MISKKDLNEIRNRDFLKNKNHFRDFDDIKTNYLFGYKVENAFLTVIVPYYDHPIEFAKRALNSVLNQYCDYEIQILVIDEKANNQSSNSFLDYVRYLNDPRIICYQNEHSLGVFANWNRAIELSDSKWITILHTDDFYKDNYLQNMKKILDENPQIDQLACNYKMLNFLKDKIDVEKEFQGRCSNSTVRKVHYTEYFYDMVTSVKGSVYKKDKLIELGGFRNQGDGIGLDDYPLMLRFAYYYNTYLLEEVLYLDSWGYNDSLNLKHWYPELVENYYMWLYFAKKETGWIQKLYLNRAKYLLGYRAVQYNDGTSWIGVPVPIDFNQLAIDCQLNNVNVNIVRKKINGICIKIVQVIKKRGMIKYSVNITAFKGKYKLK